MSKNKNFTPDRKAEMLSLYIESESYSVTAEKLGLSRQSVKQVIDRELKKPEVKSEYDKRKKSFDERFSEKAELLIEKALTALENEMDSIAGGQRSVKLNELTAAVTALFDKRALIKGESTQAVKVTVELPEEAKKYAE